MILVGLSFNSSRFSTIWRGFTWRWYALASSLNPTLEEAAMDLGATRWQTFVRITLPLILPAIVSAALLVFTISLDDYVITSFVAGPGAATLPLKIYSMVKTGVTPEIN